MLKNIYCIVGCSGSGKTTIVKELERKYKLSSIQSYTTRPKRYEGEEGHIFVDTGVFDKLPNKVAYTLFNGYEYCATAKQLEDNDLYVIDPRGIEMLHCVYKGHKQIYVIYVNTNIEDRYDRMKLRGDSHEQALRRIANDGYEFRGIENNCDFIVENNNTDNLDDVVEKVWTYIKSMEDI